MRPSRALIVINALCFVALVGFYALDVADYVRAQSAEVSALPELPNVVFAALVLVLAFAGLGAASYGLAAKKDAGFKGFRLLPILLVITAFVQALVLGEGQISLSTTQHSGIALHALAQELQGQASAAGVPDDARSIEEVVKRLGPAPYLVRAEPRERFEVQVRHGCEGPVTDAPGAEAGTFLYCVSRDRQAAWITLVGLPAEVRFGAPALFTRGGQPQVVTVVARDDSEPAQEAGEPPREH